jgi:hypothetical protein
MECNGARQTPTDGARTAIWRRWRTGRLITAATTAVLIGMAGWLLVNEEGGAVAADAVTGGIGVSDVSAADLAKVSRTRVFFGHQSVGMNILGGLPGVFSAKGVQAPPIEHRRTATDTAGGFIAETLIGENGDPVGKIKDFDAVIRGGLGRHVDVAVLKLCYIDVVPGTDVDAVFTTYRDTMGALEKDFPDVTFVKATVPLTTQPALLAKFKQRLRGNDAYGAAANSARERLNELIRKEYRGGRLFDVAAMESTAPDGARVSGRSEGRPYFALFDGYAADPGHLNADGSRRAAVAFLAAVAGASSK